MASKAPPGPKLYVYRVDEVWGFDDYDTPPVTVGDILIDRYKSTWTVFRLTEGKEIGGFHGKRLGRYDGPIGPNGKPVSHDPSPDHCLACRAGADQWGPAGGAKRTKESQMVETARERLAWLMWCYQEGYHRAEDRAILSNWLLDDPATLHKDDAKLRPQLLTMADEVLSLIQADQACHACGLLPAYGHDSACPHAGAEGAEHE